MSWKFVLTLSCLYPTFVHNPKSSMRFLFLFFYNIYLVARIINWPWMLTLISRNPVRVQFLKLCVYPSNFIGCPVPEESKFWSSTCLCNLLARRSYVFHKKKLLCFCAVRECLLMASGVVLDLSGMDWNYLSLQEENHECWQVCVGPTLDRHDLKENQLGSILEAA